MNPLIEFIKNNEDWETKLTEAPYELKIAVDKEYPDLRLFKYNQVKSDMTLPVVQTSRGIIIDTVNISTIAFPFCKFFNYNDSRAHKIDWNSARILEKVDGSIIKIYYYQDAWRIATNGCIDAFKTDLPLTGPGNIDSFGKLFVIAATKQELEYTELDKNNTYIFEVTSPYNRVVVPHKDISITHLGTRNNLTGEELIVDIGIKKPKAYSFNSFSDMVTASEDLPFDEEGYVVVDNSWNRVKVKSLAYLQVHHLADNGAVSKKRMLKLIMTGEDGELLKYYPEYEEIFTEVRAMYKEHLDVVYEIEYTAKEWVERYSYSDKAYAMMVIKNTPKAMHPYFFSLKTNNKGMIAKLERNLTDDKLLNRKEHIIKEKK